MLGTSAFVIVSKQVLLHVYSTSSHLSYVYSVEGMRVRTDGVGYCSGWR